jgi:hypothetical protein
VIVDVDTMLGIYIAYDTIIVVAVGDVAVDLLLLMVILFVMLLDSAVLSMILILEN